MGFAIGLVDIAALWAAPAGVTRIDGNYWCTGKLRLVGHELAKLTKRSPMQTVALRLPGLNPLAPGAFSVSSNLLRDAVVHMLSESGLPTRQLFEPTFGSLSATALQSCATAERPLANTLDLGARVRPPLAINGKIDDGNVNTENALDIDLRRICNVADAGEIPLASHQHQIDLTLTEGEEPALRRLIPAANGGVSGADNF